jgi:hypothetical protein
METATLPESQNGPATVNGDAERHYRRGFVAAVRACLAALNSDKDASDLEAWLTDLLPWRDNADDWLADGQAVHVAPPRMVDPIPRVNETRRQRRRRLQNQADGKHAALLAADALAGAMVNPDSEILPLEFARYVANGIEATGADAFAAELIRVARDEFDIDGEELADALEWLAEDEEASPCMAS